MAYGIKGFNFFSQRALFLRVQIHRRKLGWEKIKFKKQNRHPGGKYNRKE